MDNGSPCLFEAARRSLQAPKPSVDHLELSQLGMSRRLLNPQLYELHDDSSETTWTTNDGGERAQDATVKCVTTTDSVDTPRSKAVVSNADELELNRESDLEEIWSDCTAELHPSEDKKAVDDVEKNCSSTTENSNCCTVQKNDHGIGNNSAGKMAASSVSDADFQLAESDKSGVEAVEEPDPSTVSACSEVPPRTTPGTIAVTAADKPTGVAAGAKPTKTGAAAASKTTPTTACTTSSTTTTSSHKSERPRSSPCRASHNKQTAPIANGKDLKPPPCKTPSPAVSSKQSALSNAAAAKLLVDMVGRSKSAATQNLSSGTGGGQCKLTQCTDKVHSEAVGNTTVSADNGSCATEKTSRGTTTTAAGSNAGDRKDGKFCECWHCEFFGHMSVSCPRLFRRFLECNRCI